MKADNSDNTAIEEIRREIAKAEEKIRILKHDKLVLTKNLDLLREQTLADRENSRSRSMVDYSEDTHSMLNETSFHDSGHVE